MTQHNLTTPFGRRTMSLAMAANQMAVRDIAPESAVHKWQMFRNICEARELLGPSDRSLVVLNALLTFLPETVMTPDARLIVFPSNLQLATRAHGMAPATLRRHLAALVTLGLVIRRDSPNGKRYARKGQGGVIEAAFGFDLSPLVARAEEFARLAEQVAEQRRRRQALRERITLARRNCAKLLEAGAGLCHGPAWAGFAERYGQLACAAPRSAGLDVLAGLAVALDALEQDVASLLETKLHSHNMSGNESRNERHIQNSNKETYDIERQPAKQSVAPGLSLSVVLDACPDIREYASQDIHTWRDLHDAAGVARAALGVSPDAWNQFREDAGEDQAAAVMSAMLQRRDQIARPGGYLRALNERLRAGKFSAQPMLMALARARLRTSPPSWTQSGKI